MMNLSLKREEFLNNLHLSNPYHMFKVETISTLEIIKDDIEHLIDRFNKEYTWDDMFTFEDTIKRVKNENLIYILYKDEFPIGYCFLRKDGYIYNVFVSKEKKRTNKIPMEFIGDVINDIFNINELDYLFSECEEWNTSAQIIFLKNNFKVTVDE